MHRWRLGRALQVLVVDEVSMLSGEFFDLLDQAVTRRRAECFLRKRNLLVRTVYSCRPRNLEAMHE